MEQVLSRRDEHMDTRINRHDTHPRVPEELGILLGIRRYLAYTLENLAYTMFNPRKDPYKIALEAYRFLLELKEHALSLPLSTLAYIGVITIPLPLINLNDIKRKLLLTIENFLSRTPREYGIATVNYLVNPIKLIENIYKELSTILSRYKLERALELHLIGLKNWVYVLLGLRRVTRSTDHLYSYTTDITRYIVDIMLNIHSPMKSQEDTAKLAYPSITLESRRALDLALATLHRVRFRGIASLEEIARLKTSLSELESQVTISKISLMDTESMLKFLERSDIDDTVKRAVILGKLYAKTSSSILALTEEIVYARIRGIDKSKIKAKIYKHKHSMNKIFENLEQLSRMNKLPVKYEAISLVKKNVVEQTYNQILEALSHI